MTSATQATSPEQLSGACPCVDVVIPAYNESASLRAACTRALKALKDLGATPKIVIVDDGSTDSTWQIICDLALQIEGVDGFKLSRNFGKESAIRAGLDRCHGDAAIVMDADLQHPPELIAQLYARWLSGDHIVHAVKRQRYDSAVRRVGASVFNRLLRYASGLDLKAACDFKLLDRRVVEVYQDQFGERNRLFRGLAQWVGFRHSDVEFTVPPVEKTGSQFGFIALAGLAIDSITAFSARPLYLTSLFGLIQLIAAMVLVTQTLYRKWSGTAVSGFATVIIIELFTGSMILIALGIIGEYIRRIYDEAKARPAYVIQECTPSNSRGTGRRSGTPSSQRR